MRATFRKRGFLSRKQRANLRTELDRRLKRQKLRDDKIEAAMLKRTSLTGKCLPGEKSASVADGPSDIDIKCASASYWGAFVPDTGAIFLGRNARKGADFVRRRALLDQ